MIYFAPDKCNKLYTRIEGPAPNLGDGFLKPIYKELEHTHLFSLEKNVYLTREELRVQFPEIAEKIIEKWNKKTIKSI